eukprot:8776810-Alexandrium_andersonii.AAC.1
MSCVKRATVWPGSPHVDASKRMQHATTHGMTQHATVNTCSTAAHAAQAVPIHPPGVSRCACSATVHGQPASASGRGDCLLYTSDAADDM